MRLTLSRILILISAILVFGFSATALGEKEKRGTSKDQSEYYMYTLQVVPALLNQDNWTEKENRIIEEHFQRLKQFRDEGIVIFAGRVSTMDPEGFGIVILKRIVKKMPWQ